MSYPTGYYGIYDPYTERFILGIQEPSRTKAMHKLKCRVNEDIIKSKSWLVKSICDNHKSHFNQRLKWKGVNVRAKEMSSKWVKK